MFVPLFVANGIERKEAKMVKISSYQGLWAHLTEADPADEERGKVSLWHITSLV